jgi:hypothetical protein
MLRRILSIAITTAVLYALLMVLMTLFNIGRQFGGGAAQPQGSGAAPSAESGKQRPTLEQMREMVQLEAGATRGEGTAVAVLVDTSGSMRESVADVDGQSHPKMDIAKRCLVDLLARCSAFATAHPDKPLLVGVYEFSVRRGEPSCRPVVPLGKPGDASIERAIQAMQPKGDTPIGEAMVAARKDLNRAGLSRTHILVITDGQNTRGLPPEQVTAAIAGLPEESRSSIYFIAFDVAASRFNAVREAGGLVLPASSGSELGQTLDYILTGKILAEQPEPPAGGG